MSEQDFNDLRGELDGWRARFDQARLKANLGKMELRDKLNELMTQFEDELESSQLPADQIKTGVKEIVDAGRKRDSDLQEG